MFKQTTLEDYWNYEDFDINSDSEVQNQVDEEEK